MKLRERCIIVKKASDTSSSKNGYDRELGLSQTYEDIFRA